MTRPAQSRLERSLSIELLYGRSEDLRVFVSSKMRDGSLAAERRAAIRAINSHPWHKAWAWETSVYSGPYSARRVCVASAETSDVLVLLLADELTPVTRSEYLAAKRAKVPRVILIKDGVPQSDAVRRFVDRERAQKVVTAQFRNVPELRSQIRGALKKYGVYVHRVHLVHERAVSP